MQKTIYIAGKVTGEPQEACKAKFAAAEKQWEAKDYDVLNPMKIVQDFDTPWGEAMRICLAALTVAQECYFLADWENSRGARLEHQIAKSLEIPIHYKIAPIDFKAFKIERLKEVEQYLYSIGFKQKKYDEKNTTMYLWEFYNPTTEPVITAYIELGQECTMDFEIPGFALPQIKSREDIEQLVRLFKNVKI